MSDVPIFAVRHTLTIIVTKRPVQSPGDHRVGIALILTRILLSCCNTKGNKHFFEECEKLAYLLLLTGCRWELSLARPEQQEQPGLI